MPLQFAKQLVQLQQVLCDGEVLQGEVVRVHGERVVIPG